MTLSKGQQKELLEAAKPLIKWMNDHCHHHCKVIVDQSNVEVVEGITQVGTTEFLKE